MNQRQAETLKGLLEKVAWLVDYTEANPTIPLPYSVAVGIHEMKQEAIATFSTFRDTGGTLDLLPTHINRTT